MVVHRHLVEAVFPRHGKRELANPIRIFSQVNAADQQVLVDHLEDVVKPCQGGVQIFEQNVFSRFERARGLGQGDFFQAVARLDVIVGVAGDSGVVAARLCGTLS